MPRCMLNLAVFRGVIAYLRRYPHTLIAPLMLETPDERRQEPSPDPRAPGRDGRRRARTGGAGRCCARAAINLQRYTANRGGYPYWHCELYPRDPRAETLHRHLLWTIYLNDDFDEGETEFLYQHRKIVPAHGQPADRTGGVHPHPSRQPSQGRRQVHRDQLGAVPARGAVVRGGVGGRL